MIVAVNRPHKGDETSDVLKDKQAFSPVENRIGVREALVVADIVKVFEHRDGRLQDAFRHLAFDQVPEPGRNRGSRSPLGEDRH